MTKITEKNFQELIDEKLATMDIPEKEKEAIRRTALTNFRIGNLDSAKKILKKNTKLRVFSVMMDTVGAVSTGALLALAAPSILDNFTNSESKIGDKAAMCTLLTGLAFATSKLTVDIFDNIAHITDNQISMAQVKQTEKVMKDYNI